MKFFTAALKLAEFAQDVNSMFFLYHYANSAAQLSGFFIAFLPCKYTLKQSLIKMSKLELCDDHRAICSGNTILSEV